ncbi:maleylacetoacetate isomerase [Asticcacaulis solisilvae]|uniref:maleylacetoacetate isomerase n=1 Tax=Asticcacaulis solisilvae TaxID=1217274 RepID=UPI003FD83258
MLRLHSYWRSSAVYRVRIALNLKGLDYETVGHDLRTDQQSTPAYKAINPQGLVPALDDGDHILTQSVAILEWLEETHPNPPLLPKAPIDRAHVRALVSAVVADIHPLNNLRIQKYLKAEFGADQAALDAWCRRWIASGFDAIEELIGRHGAGFAFGDRPTLADCCLVPQVLNAGRVNLDLAPWPLIRAVNQACLDLPAFARAQPQHQPDADPPADA